MRRKRVIHETRADRVFDVFNSIFLVLIFIAVAYPIIYVISASFSDPRAIISGKVWLFPVNPSLESYRLVFNYPKTWTGFYNSFYYAIFGTIINVILTVMIAYPLSRKDFKFRNILTFVFAFTMWFNGGLIPTYLLVRDLGMINTRWAMLLPNAINVYNMIITRTYFQNNIPWELLESARLDGCDDYKFIWKIVLPLSAPIIAVISLFYAVSHWNAFFQAFLYLTKQELLPLQIILRDVLILSKVQDVMADQETFAANAEFMSEVLKNAMIVIASLPVILVYPFIQKYFVKGIMIGAIKG